MRIIPKRAIKHSDEGFVRQDTSGTACESEWVAAFLDLDPPSYLELRDLTCFAFDLVVPQ